VSEEKLRGYIPGNTNADFLYITGAIISWWARTEGIMVHDVMALRTWPFSKIITDKQEFPTKGRSLIKQWRDLIQNGYRTFDLEVPDFSSLVNDAIELMGIRHTLSHSFWPYGQKERDVLEVNWMKRDDSSPTGVKRGIYRATLKDLDNVNTRLAHLYTSVMAASFNSHKLYALGEKRFPV